MKNLFLLRHANASLILSGIQDFDRPLNEKGKADAELIGRKLFQKNFSIDYMISSGAIRAYSTSKIIAENINYPIDAIEINNDIYNSRENMMMEIINNISDKYNFVVIVGHNPVLHYLSNLLTNESILKFPTCTLCNIEFDVDSWINVCNGKKQFIIYPELFEN